MEPRFAVGIEEMVISVAVCVERVTEVVTLPGDRVGTFVKAEAIRSSSINGKAFLGEQVWVFVRSLLLGQLFLEALGRDEGE